MMQDLIINAIKPHIKPSFQNAEKDIVKLIKEAEEKFLTHKKGHEITFQLAKHKDRIIIIPTILIDDDDTDKQFIELASEEIMDELIKPQPLVDYLISNFTKVLKDK